MKVKLNRALATNIALFLITISEAKFINTIGLDKAFEYIGYGILLASVFIYFLKVKHSNKKMLDSLFFAVFALLTGIGVILQDVSTVRMLTLLFTIVGIAMVTILTNGYVKTYNDIRKMAYSIMCGTIVVFILGCITGTGISEQAYDGIMGISFSINGGMMYKNYFAADMVAIFIGLFVANKGNSHKTIDYVIMACTVFLLVLSNSRGGLVIFAVFIAASYYKLLYRIDKIYRYSLIVILIGVCSIVAINMYGDIVVNFATYAYRFRGWNNYINYYKDDTFHMIFGNAESFYDQPVSYVMAVRNRTGMDGSLEMAWLNILIKSGLLGIIGYSMLYIRYIINTKSSTAQEASSVIAIIAALLVSSLVEAYIQSVHCVFAIMCYLIITGIRQTKQTRTISKEKK